MKEIKLTQGKVALVDDEDFEWLSQWKWYGSHDYPARRSYGKFIYMHRIILNAPVDKEVDHINGNRRDNRRLNLRICTSKENTRNVRMRCDNNSGFKGVYWKKDRKKWCAEISYDGHRLYIGCFTDPIEAAHAYDKAARDMFGEFAKTNFE